MWTAWMWCVVDKCVARNTVARVNKDDVATLLIALDERDELWHYVDVGVYIVC